MRVFHCGFVSAGDVLDETGPLLGVGVAWHRKDEFAEEGGDVNTFPCLSVSRFDNLKSVQHSCVEGNIAELVPEMTAVLGV